MATKSTTFNDFGQNITANTSALTINIYFSAQNTSTWFNGKTLYCSCDGQNQSASVSHPRGGSVSASFTFYNIPHDADGSRTIGWSWSCATGTSSLGTISDAGALTLQTIPRASQPSINTWPGNSPNFNIGDTITIHMNKKADFRHKVYFVYGSTSHLVAENVVDYCTFDTSTIANELYALIPNSNTYSNVVRVETYNGSQLIGTATCNYNANVTDANPIFSNFEYEDINSTTLALTGDSTKNINGYSTIKATISTTNKAQAQKGATMSKYRFIIDTQTIDINYSDSESVNGSIQNSSIGTYNVYAIDSRNNSTLVTKLASENIAYTPISFNSSSCKVERNNGGVGEYAVLTLSGNIWNNNFGQVTNSIKNVVVEYKETGSSTWLTSPTTITPTVSGNSFSFEGQVGSQEEDYKFELNKSYDFRVTVTDELSTKSIQLTPMASAVPNISLADDGVGIMCDYDEELGGPLQVAGKRIDKELLYNGPATLITINLDVDTADYLYIDILYTINSGRSYVKRVYEPDGKTIVLDGMWITGDGNTMQVQAKTYEISGSSISFSHVEKYFNVNNNPGTVQLGTQDTIEIHKIYGCRA